MSTWAEFYREIRDPTWPDCDHEEDFAQLPGPVQTECQERFGYVPGSFRNKSKRTNRRFPITSATACQLKWTWSTIYLTTEKTASCHRTNHHKFDTEQFDFHNTPSKLDDRQRMLEGKWPLTGCNYCQDIETAGGASDRITNLDFPGIHAPPELDHDPRAVRVTPRMLEVYFDNTCNLKCLYCGPHFSSLWDAENVRHGVPAFAKSPNIESNKLRLFEWLKQNSHELSVFNILGGEPLYQPELEQCLELFEQHPAPELKLQMFTNLNARLPHLQRIIQRVQRLIDSGSIREFEITASLDCWGAPQEYVRFPLNLAEWEKNFEYLLSQSWINLIINSTVTPLTTKTLPDLLQKINHWNQTRPVYHYQNSVNGPDYMFIDLFGPIFQEDFARALALKPARNPEETASRNYLMGIAQQSAHGGPRPKQIRRLFDFLNTMDQRRHTSWPQTFPWLVDEFAQYNLRL
jgi:MoaA/NifB/PqqE/SkfB family radical SAM enzyme